MQTSIKLLLILLACFSTFILYAACRVSKDHKDDEAQEDWCREHGKRKDQ